MSSVLSSALPAAGGSAKGWLGGLLSPHNLPQHPNPTNKQNNVIGNEQDYVRSQVKGESKRL